jgi:5-methylcytosine-specific restriction protein A
MKVGKRNNPNWIRDEELLLVDLYLAFREKKIPGSRHAKVIELSRLLTQMPWHSRRTLTFRNAAGIALKLQNLKSIETGQGMSNSSAMDRQVLSEFVDQPAQLSEIAASIRRGVGFAKSLGVVEADLNLDVVFTEGRLLTAIHLRRERDPRLRREFLRQRQDHNRCFCDLCGLSFETVASSHRMAAFEVHHLLPLRASVQSRRTTYKDVALLCAVCHRLIHSAIAENGRWLDIGQAKAVLCDQDSP